jgi:hypothetical protein
MEHFEHSPKMFRGTVYCNNIDDMEKLKNMSIDRRWNEDNRIYTWTFGAMNFGFDQNFLYKGGVINDTDNRHQTILGETENSTHEIIGSRNIRYNGNWFKMK